MSLRDEILKAESENPKAPVPFVVPDWQLTVHIKPWTAAERIGWEESCVDGKSPEVRQANCAKAIIAALVDEEGKPAFTAADQQFVESLTSRTLFALFGKVSDVNKLSVADADSLKKNSDAAPADSPTS